MSYCCEWNSICGWSDESDAFQERRWGACLPLTWCVFSARWSDSCKRLTASEQIELWRHQRDGSDSLFHFHHSVRHYLHRCSDDPLMCGIAEPLTAQWTDKCRYKAVSLVCITLCSCPQWKNNVRVRHWPPPPPVLNLQLFYGNRLPRKT